MRKISVVLPEKTIDGLDEIKNELENINRSELIDILCVYGFNKLDDIFPIEDDSDEEDIEEEDDDEEEYDEYNEDEEEDDDDEEEDDEYDEEE